MTDTIELEEVDILRLENSNLKLGMAMREAERLRSEQDALLASIADRLGVDDLRNYAIDTRTRKGVRNADK